MENKELKIGQKFKIQTYNEMTATSRSATVTEEFIIKKINENGIEAELISSNKYLNYSGGVIKHFESVKEYKDYYGRLFFI